MSDGVAKVCRLATELAARVRYAQIVGHPIPAEQLAALVAAARLLQDYGEPWPYVVAEALHEVADGLDNETMPAAVLEGKRDSVVAGLSRFLDVFRREKRSAPETQAN